MSITYRPIATQTLGSTATSVVFNSIPNTYTDLVVVCNNLFVSSGTPNLRVQLNSDTNANYSVTVLESFQGTIYSRRQSNITGIDLGYFTYLYPTSTSSYPSNAIINVMNYKNSSTFKTVLGRYGSSFAGTTINVGTWRNTSAVTSVTIANSTPSVTFNVGSTFSLYGIKAE